MSTYLSFVITSVILALTPGPDVLLVLAIAAKDGFKKAFQLTMGLASGVIFHTALILMGFSALIIASPLAMNLIALFGAGYLVYLAWLTWLYRSDQTKPTASTEIQGSYYFRGVIMNISNPKVLLFFLALFPQFAHLDQPGYQFRIVMLGLIFITVTVVVFGGLAFITAKTTQGFMQNPRFKKSMDFLTILIFVSLAMLLLFSIIDSV